MKIKIKCMEKGIQSNYIKAIRSITKCFILNTNSSHQIDDNVAVLMTKNTFNTVYKTTYLLEYFPPHAPSLQKMSRTCKRQASEVNVAMDDVNDGSLFALHPLQYQ
eukprot:7329118-Ditylum_brightwellii.AAC.1